MYQFINIFWSRINNPWRAILNLDLSIALQLITYQKLLKALFIVGKYFMSDSDIELDTVTKFFVFLS